MQNMQISLLPVQCLKFSSPLMNNLIDEIIFNNKTVGSRVQGGDRKHSLTQNMKCFWSSGQSF